VTSRSARHLQEQLHHNTTVPRFELPDWLERFGVVAGVTAGHGDLDFALSDSGTAGDLWEGLATELGDFRSTVVSRQPHGGDVGIHTDLGPGLTVLQGLDGHVTREANVLLAVTVADCVPVYLVAPSAATIGILHAGWRGTAAGILEAGVRALVERSRQPPEKIVMHCGIAICGSCYEVGPEVAEAVVGMRPPGPGPLDLRGVLVLQAHRLGLRSVSVSDFCTAHDPSAFHSHRASGPAAGRMAAYIGRRSG
jgi:YfiH family protein